MKIELIKQKFLEIIQKQNNLKGRVLDDFTEATELFVEIYGEYPKCYYASGILDRKKTSDAVAEKYPCFMPGSYDFYKDTDGEFNYEEIVYDGNILLEDALVTIERDGISIYTNNEELKDDLLKLCVRVEVKNPCEVYWVTNGQNGFGASKLVLKEAKFNPENHYNEDFDFDKVEKFATGDESGIMILYGTPGTGKTYAIRNLAQRNPKKKFYFMDKSTFEYIGTASFISFLFGKDIRDSVFVLEDCETLLADRVRNGNHLLTTILNLSDGILGDGLNIKFICTFNAKLDKIDPAILRKGRLKYKYEFKALTPEKTQALAKELGKHIPEGESLPVCDIYNWEEENNGEQINKPRKIGF